MNKIKDEITALLDSTLDNINKKKDEEETEEEIVEIEEETEEEESTEEGHDGEEDDKSDENVDDKPDPNQDLKNELAELKEQIADLKDGNKEKEVKKPAEIKFDDVVVAAEGDFEGISESHEDLNKFANKISQRTQENILKALPNIINNLVTQSVSLQTSVTEFWRSNEDLVAGKTQREIGEVKKKIGSISNALLAADPTKSYGEIFEEAGNIVRGNGRKPKIAKKKKKVASIKAPAASKGREIKGKANTTQDKIDALFTY